MEMRTTARLGLAVFAGFVIGVFSALFFNSRPALAQESKPRQIIETDLLRARTIELGDGTQRIQFVMERDGSLSIHLMNIEKDGKMIGQLQFRTNDPPTLQVLDKSGKVAWKAQQ